GGIWGQGKRQGSRGRGAREGRTEAFHGTNSKTRPGAAVETKLHKRAPPRAHRPSSPGSDERPKGSGERAPRSNERPDKRAWSNERPHEWPRPDERADERAGPDKRTDARPPPLYPGAEHGRASPIRIDGRFNGWASVATEAMARGSGLNPNIDVVRFGVVDNLGPFAFYVEVAGTALQGGGPSPGTMDSMRIF